MDTYFNFIPLELDILLLSKASSEDVGNLLITLNSIYTLDILGRELSIKIFNVKPKFNYSWGEVFKVYYQVKKLGFNEVNIKSPIIDRSYDQELISCTGYEREGKPLRGDKLKTCQNLDRRRLTLANSYGVLPSELLRFLYKEGIYIPDILTYMWILIPLMRLHEYQSVEKIIDWIVRSYGNISNDDLPLGSSRIIDEVIHLTLKSGDPQQDKVKLIEKIGHLIKSADFFSDYTEKYLQQTELTNENIDVIKVLLDVFPEIMSNEVLLHFHPKIIIDMANTFHIDISYDVISSLSDNSDIILILEYILSGRYSQELSNPENRDILLGYIYDNLRNYNEYNLAQFKRLSQLIYKITTH